MTKTEFLNIMDKSLGNIPNDEKNEILYDYEEHFNIAMAEGKSEAEIAKHLGDPRTLSKQYRAQSILKEAESNTTTGNIFKAVLAAVGLGFFNLVFVLGPFIGVVGILIGFYGTSISLTFAGIVLFFASLISFFINSINIGADPLFGLFLSIGISSLGILFTIGNIYLTKIFFSITVKYLKMNISLINKE